MQLFRERYSDPKRNAQDNLSGRTHYVDDDTLRWHVSRILGAYVADDGLTFAIIESVQLGPHASAGRGFRHVIFDLFGDVVSRPDLDSTYRTRKAAEKALYAALEAHSPLAHTLASIETQKARYIRDMDELAAQVNAIRQRATAGSAA